MQATQAARCQASEPANPGEGEADGRRMESKCCSTNKKGEGDGVKGGGIIIFFGDGKKSSDSSSEASSQKNNAIFLARLSRTKTFPSRVSHSTTDSTRIIFRPTQRQQGLLFWLLLLR
jgi:hypothetical protein